MKKPKLPERSTLVNQLDAIFGLRIKLRDKRARGCCPFHEDYRPIEQVFHFLTRSKHSIRWDDRNAVGSCAGCNLKYEHDQGFVDQVLTWYKTTFGEEAWARLVRDGNMIMKRSRSDLKELRDKMRAEFNGGSHG